MIDFACFYDRNMTVFDPGWLASLLCVVPTRNGIGAARGLLLRFSHTHSHRHTHTNPGDRKQSEEVPAAPSYQLVPLEAARRRASEHREPVP